MLMKDKLVYARAVLNLTQQALAQKLDVSFATINRWEKGRSVPQSLTMYRFEKFCEEQGIFFKE